MPANAGHKTVAVIRTYNEAQYVTRLVGDLFRLSEPLDVWIVDDNSPDGTGRLADELTKQYPTGCLSAIARARAVSVRRTSRDGAGCWRATAAGS